MFSLTPKRIEDEKLAVKSIISEELSKNTIDVNRNHFCKSL